MAAWYVLAPTVTVDATLRLNLNHSFVLCGAVYGLEQASGMTVSCNDATDRCTPLAGELVGGVCVGGGCGRFDAGLQPCTVALLEPCRRCRYCWPAGPHVRGQRRTLASSAALGGHWRGWYAVCVLPL